MSKELHDKIATLEKELAELKELVIKQETIELKLLPDDTEFYYKICCSDYGGYFQCMVDDTDTNKSIGFIENDFESGLAFLTEDEAQNMLDLLKARKKMIDVIRVENFKANNNYEWSAKDTLNDNDVIFSFYYDVDDSIIGTDSNTSIQYGNYQLSMISYEVAQTVKAQLGDNLIKFVITGEK